MKEDISKLNREVGEIKAEMRTEFKYIREKLEELSPKKSRLTIKLIGLGGFVVTTIGALFKIKGLH